MAKFDYVETPFAGFVLADERLSHAEATGYLDLGESSVSAELAQQRTELLVLLRPDGLLHPESAPWLRKYPNLGYLLWIPGHRVSAARRARLVVSDIITVT